MSEGSRIKWLDSLKGFAIINVVLGHILKSYLDANTFPQYNELMNNIYNVITLFHMPLFMILSGFLFSKAYTEGLPPESHLRKKRAKKHILNLIIIYYMYSLLLGISKLFFSSQVINKVSINDIMMIWARPIQLYWYLYVLIIFTLLFSLDFIRNKFLFLFFAVSFITSLVAYLLKLPPLFEMQKLLFYCFFFIFGIVLNYKSYFIKKYIKYILILSILVSCFLIYFYFTNDVYINKIPIVSTLVALSVSLVLIYLFENVSFISSFQLFCICGKYSLPIYLLHTFFVTACRKLLGGIGIHHFHSNIAVNLCISVLLPILIAIISKKTGLYKVLFSPADLIPIK